MGNLVELKKEELMEIGGGWWPLLIVAAVVEIIQDWDNFKNGLAGRPEVK